MDNSKKKHASNDYRQKAEDNLKAKQSGLSFNYTEVEMLKIIHELEVHQIELELVNEELILANDEANFANKKYADLYNFAPMGYVTLSKDGRIIETNLTFSQMIFKERSHLKHMLFSHFVSNDTKLQFEDFLRNIFAGSMKDLSNVTLLTESGIPLYVHLKGRITDDGEFCFLAVIDITKLKLAEEELAANRSNLEDLILSRTEKLNSANISLLNEIEKDKDNEALLSSSLAKEKELNELKSRFISTTSHEFRTPLTVILSSAELLHRYSGRFSAEKMESHFDRIRNSVEYLVSLLEEILTVNSSDTIKADYNPEMLDLQKLAADCINEVKPLLNDNHTFELSCQLTRKGFYLGPKLMKYIFYNLFSNAIKYSPNGGKISVTILEKEKLIELNVRDEGMGIPKDEIGKIFNSFYRTKTAIGIPGNGLGLSIVKHAVELHGGKISVKSRQGKGTEFTIELPIKN